jgi:hypothetical protein
LDAAWEVAKPFRAFGAYGSEEQARAALRRRCRGLTEEQCGNALHKALGLYDTAVELVARDAAALWERTDVRTGRTPDFLALPRELQRRCPGFRITTCRTALAWVFYWHHLK